MTATVDISRLQEVIERHDAESDAEIGVLVRHVQTGHEVVVNGDALHLMASVFKIPVLLTALAQSDEGRLDLNRRVELHNDDQLPTSMVLEHLQPGLRPTVRDLLTAMITVSDNTATDMVLKEIGLESVDAQLRSWGLRNISVCMGVEGLFADAFHSEDSSETLPALYRRMVARGPVVDPFTGAMDEGFTVLVGRGPDWEAVAAARSLENNVATPVAMGELLVHLVLGDLLSRENTAVALDIMLRQQLNQRLPRFLPRTVRIAHKTGTFYSARNDAGILYVPDGGRVVLVTFAVLKRDLLEQDPLQSVPYIDRVDAAMGHIARSSYDAFTSA
jgi:beta-lactamase class A